jgi:hypothetical protein
MRRLVAELQQVEIQVIHKGPGSVITNMVETDGKFRATKGPALSKSNPESSLLPDNTLQLGKVQNGEVYTGKNVPVIVNNKDLLQFENAPVVLLPMADGSTTVSPLYMPRLDEASSLAALNTMERAMYLYLKSGTDAEIDAEIEQVRKQTGYDFRSSSELRRFITSQFTYLQSFDDTHTARNSDMPEFFMFNITEPPAGKATIMIGTAHSGVPMLVANIQDNKIDPNFIMKWRTGISTRYKSVNYTTDTNPGINSSGRIAEHYWTGKKWSSQQFDNYNEYVKTYATTYAYGRNQLNGQYVYAANPAIMFDESTVKAKLDPSTPISPVLIASPTGSTTVAQSQDSVEMGSADFEELGESLGEFNKIHYPSIPTDINPAEDANMQLVTLEVLQDLANFTPSENRNELTIQEAFDNILKSGTPYLPKGFNPFRKCS